MNPLHQDDLETIRAEIILGEKCDAFFHTDPGRYVKARAMEVVMQSIDNLKVTSAGNKERIEEIQLELKSAENALQWLNEAIQNGRQAMQQLEIMSDNEGV